MGLNDAGDPSFLSDVQKVFAPRVSGVWEIYEPGPGQGAGLPGGRAAHRGAGGVGGAARAGAGEGEPALRRNMTDALV